MSGWFAVRWLSVGVACLTLVCSVAPEASAQEKPKFEQLVEGKTRVPGMWNLYWKDQTLLAEIRPEHLGRDFIVLPTIARGISQMPVIGGMTWYTGDDDMLWSFRKVDDKLMLQRRNVRFKAKPGSPEASAVEKAYSDSILFALPIMSTGPSGGAASSSRSRASSSERTAVRRHCLEPLPRAIA